MSKLRDLLKSPIVFIFMDPVELAARDLMRRVDPKYIEENLYDACRLNMDVSDTLLNQIDVPHKIGTDSQGNEFILCDCNRDGDSYRSPYTSEYVPPLDDGIQPPPHLRELELMANKGFQAYLKHYFEVGVCSVYVWETGDDSFAVGVYVRKEVENDGDVLSGLISCSDVCECTPLGNNMWSYSLVSTALVNVHFQCEIPSPLDLNGHVEDQNTETHEVKEPIDHLVHIGEMIEKNASNFVELIRSRSVSKMTEILETMKVDDQSANTRALMKEFADKAFKK